MNIIMSRALPHHHPSRVKSPVASPQRPRELQHEHAVVPSSTTTPNSPQSPLLDYINRIPYHEVRMTNETLGSGSFGTVFKGEWRQRPVAVKEFKRAQRDSFLTEVQQLSVVKHPNIITLYGHITLPDTCLLIMEFAEGGSLNHLLHESKEQQGYDLRHACSWARQAARGVAYLHGIRPKPIMHRDLKPANLLLFSRGQILKICDFGTACDVKTQMTNNTGSPSYMAPEVFASSSYLESGDVFSWSIIFWETLVRVHPYGKSFSNPYQILWSVNKGARPAEIEDCPKPIWNLITKSWDNDPKKRPSMASIAREMDFIFSMATKPIDTRQNQQNSTSGGHHQKQSNRLRSGSTTPLNLPSPSLHQPQTSPASSRNVRTHLPSVRSALETTRSNISTTERMTSTTDHLYEHLRQNQFSHIASSASTSQYQHHHQIDDHHNYHQDYQQSNRQLISRIFKAKKKIGLCKPLVDGFKQLDQVNCDNQKKNREDMLKEFENLKELIRIKKNQLEVSQRGRRASEFEHQIGSPQDPLEGQQQQHYKPDDEPHQQSDLNMVELSTKGLSLSSDY